MDARRIRQRGLAKDLAAAAAAAAAATAEAASHEGELESLSNEESLQDTNGCSGTQRTPDTNLGTTPTHPQEFDASEPCTRF